MNVVFDLDGTLIDSAPDIRAAVNRMLAAEGLAALDLPTVVSFVGHGLPTLVSRVIAHCGLPLDQHARLTAATLAEYNQGATKLTRLYPGVEDALAALKHAGHRLGICTNKPEPSARALLVDMGLMQHFQSVVGGGRLPMLKPDPAMLHLSVQELGGGPACFVGDSEVDADTAVAAGVPFLLFTEGYRKSPVAALPHKAAFNDYRELAALIR
jgi:phosphoglycolate phosphatase